MQQDVLGFDVAVDHALPVGVVQRVGDGRGNAHRLIYAELRFAIEFRAQRLAVNERHHIVKERICLARIEERQDVRFFTDTGHHLRVDRVIRGGARCLGGGFRQPNA